SLRHCPQRGYVDCHSPGDSCPGNLLFLRADCKLSPIDFFMHPLALIAELTHRCPLHCVYCSNPLELSARANELSTEIWSRVFREAAAAGVLHVDFTGGEPLARTDIVDLVKSARAANLYVNLITSGLPLDEEKLDALIAAGLDHFQLSFQAADPALAAEI